MEKTLIRNQIIVLDYGNFENTRFEDCTLIYKGGRPPTLIDNEFIDCEWSFENEAGHTLAFLRSLIEGGGREFVAQSLGLDQQ